MKPLLFDHNLSPKLLRRLAELYPNSKEALETLLRENFEAIETLSDNPSTRVITLF
jgi:hypothetical protein